MIFDEMCKITTDIRLNIIQHPFNQELSQGVLPEDKFIFYLQQDALYLEDYSRALALTPSRLSCKHQARTFMKFALDAIKSEQEVQEKYLSKLSRQVHLEQYPACFMYTNYLLRLAAHASVEESVAALLPCFSVYMEVGRYMANISAAQNRYQEWIDLYSSDAFSNSVNAAVEILNHLGGKASTHSYNKMIDAFKAAARLEWYFWECAYKKERWAL